MPTARGESSGVCDEDIGPLDSDGRPPGRRLAQIEREGARWCGFGRLSNE